MTRPAPDIPAPRIRAAGPGEETAAPYAAPPARDPAEDLIYRISHDLQAPARALCALPDWIADDLAEEGVDLPDPVAGHLRMMQVQAGRLQAMIRDLLTYSRIGRPQPAFDGDWDMLLAATRAALPGAERFAIACDLVPAAPAIGQEDAGHLLAALLSNAIKHHDEGAGAVALRLTLAEGAVELSVTDDGPGIPPDQVARALGMMETLRARDEVEGSGMGLPIVARICERYGGDLSLAPAPGRGLCVTVILPAASASG